MDAHVPATTPQLVAPETWLIPNLAPIMTGDAIQQAFDVVRELAGRPIIPSPGQELLDDLVAGILAGAPA